MVAVHCLNRSCAELCDDDKGTDDDDEDKEMKDANYKCRAQGGNASCIHSLALPLMQKELGLLII